MISFFFGGGGSHIKMFTYLKIPEWLNNFYFLLLFSILNKWRLISFYWKICFLWLKAFFTDTEIIISTQVPSQRCTSPSLTRKEWFSHANLLYTNAEVKPSSQPHLGKVCFLFLSVGLFFSSGNVWRRQQHFAMATLHTSGLCKRSKGKSICHESHTQIHIHWSLWGIWLRWL